MISSLQPYRAMKDSGIEWLGEIPEHWELERGKNLFTKAERPVRKTDQVVTCFRDGTVTLRRNRRTQGFTESLKEFGYQGIRVGDLVIHAMDAFAGAVGVADSDGKGTPVYAVCKPKPRANAYYHSFVIREMARRQWILALATGIRERSTDFRFGAYANQRVPLPPLPEQAAIVRFIDYVDRRIRRYIRAKRKLIKLLEEQKQAIIRRAVTRGLNPDVPLKDSGVEWLGQVPEHWEVRKLRQCGPVVGGMTPSMEVRRFWDGEIPWVTPKDMKKQAIGDSGIRVTPVALEETSLRLIEPGAILLVVRGMILARKVPIAWTENPVTINQDMKAIRPNKGVDAKYLATMLDSAHDAFIPLIDEAGHGTKRLPTERWRDLAVALPPLEEQIAIAERLDQATADIDTIITRANREIELLNEYRTRLIADVVTGKLDVREAAASLPNRPDEPESPDKLDEIIDAEMDQELDRDDLPEDVE